MVVVKPVNLNVDTGIRDAIYKLPYATHTDVDYKIQHAMDGVDILMWHITVSICVALVGKVPVRKLWQ